VNIGVLGTGAMGRALALAWSTAGHRVLLGSRDSERGDRVARGVSARARAGSEAVIGGTAAEAAEFGRVVVLAVPWTAVGATLEGVRSTLAHKVLVDCTNPMVDAHQPLLVGRTTSGAEEIQAAVPECAVVKAFNALAARVIGSLDPAFAGQRAQVFHCGDDAAARDATAGLITDARFEPRDVGPLCFARYLEPLAAFSVLLDLAERREVEIAIREMARERKTRG
jgi:NADPH-dependent F420 reductase